MEKLNKRLTLEHWRMSAPLGFPLRILLPFLEMWGRSPRRRRREGMSGGSSWFSFFFFLRLEAGQTKSRRMTR